MIKTFIKLRLIKKYLKYNSIDNEWMNYYFNRKQLYERNIKKDKTQLWKALNNLQST